jgi:hypothetical protein
MYSIFYSSLAAAMISMTYGATIAQRDIPDEIVYLTNCLGNGIAESQMNYYKEYANSKAGQLPDSTAILTVNGNQIWEGQSVTGTFIGGGGVQFTVSGLDFNTPIGQATGSGTNGYASFTCYREQLLTLYTNGDNVCTKLYSCAHSNHIEFTQTQATLSSNTIDINNAVSGNTAFSNANSAFNSQSNTCSDTAYQIGSGCTITFSCSAENSNIYNSMAQYLIDGVGANIPSKTMTIPATCPNDRACTQDPGVLKCCDSTTAPANTFPTSGTINAFNIDEANPNNPSIQASLSYSITCPAPPGCNNGLCNAIASAVGAISVNPAFAALGVILDLVCLDCN